MTFTLTGFSTVKREGIELTAGFTAIVNGDLRVGAVSETVNVSVATPIVDVQNVSAQNVLTRDRMDAVPANQSLLGLAEVTLGMVPSASGVYGSGGGRRRQQGRTDFVDGRPR